jgi:hypothetical protein
MQRTTAVIECAILNNPANMRARRRARRARPISKPKAKPARSGFYSPSWAFPFQLELTLVVYLLSALEVCHNLLWLRRKVVQKDPCPNSDFHPLTAPTPLAVFWPVLSPQASHRHALWYTHCSGTYLNGRIYCWRVRCGMREIWLAEIVFSVFFHNPSVSSPHRHRLSIPHCATFTDAGGHGLLRALLSGASVV